MDRGFALEPTQWAQISQYSDHQAEEAAAGRGPKRTVAVEERYTRYKQWCAQRGHTTLELLKATAIWRRHDGASGALAALEPNIVPYHLEQGIEHWVLWYDPEATAPTTDLARADCARHANAFFPVELQLEVGEELICFQNLPEFRSVPEMAHAHVFMRPGTAAKAAALASLRKERRIRSPWAEAERLGGRGHEVGYS
jgi:hypothetical protein